MPDLTSGGPFTSGDSVARMIEKFAEVAADTQLDIRQDAASAKAESLDTYKEMAPPEDSRKLTKTTKQERLQKLAKPDKTSADQQKLKYRDSARKFNKSNKELDENKLFDLAEAIEETSSEEEILNKIKDLFPDEYLADQAFDFLLDVASDKGKEKLLDIKEKHFSEHSKEIVAGRNINQAAQKYAQELKKPTIDARQEYISFLDSQKGLVEQFFDILGASPSFKDFQSKIVFLRTSVGDDLHAEASSIEKEKLMVLVKQSNALQVLGTVPRELENRLPIIKTAFESAGIPFPANKLDLLNMTKMEFKLLKEAYPTSERLINLVEQESGVMQTKGLIAVVEALLTTSQSISHKLYPTAQRRSDVIKSGKDAATDLYQKEENEENALNSRIHTRYLDEGTVT